MSKFIDIQLDESSERQVKRGLKQYGIDAAKSIYKALIAVGFYVESEAKKKITVDDHIVTNRLRSSIHTEYKGGNSFGRRIVGVNNMSAASEGMDARFAVAQQADEVYVGTNVEYGPKIEAIDSFIGHAAVKGQKEAPKRIKKELDKLTNEYNR